MAVHWLCIRTQHKFSVLRDPALNIAGMEAAFELRNQDLYLRTCVSDPGSLNADPALLLDPSESGSFQTNVFMAKKKLFDKPRHVPKSSKPLQRTFRLRKKQASSPTENSSNMKYLYFSIVWGKIFASLNPDPPDPEHCLLFTFRCANFWATTGTGKYLLSQQPSTYSTSQYPK
jgi:hypothetical protein